MDEVRKKSLSGKKTGTHNPAQGGGKTQPDRQPCKRCGKHHSSTEKCLARNATCYKCQRKGHFSSQCLKKSAPTDELTTETVNVDQFLGVVSSNTDSAWLITVQLEDKGVTFKLDTGAEVTAISEEAVKSHFTASLQVTFWTNPQCHTSVGTVSRQTASWRQNFNRNSFCDSWSQK